LSQRTSVYKKSTGFLVHVKGRVQGVGFRPFVYRLAKTHSLKGFVFNRPDGVIAHIEGDKKNCRVFLEELENNAPPAANIKEIIPTGTKYKNFDDFLIVPSVRSEGIITEISPDIAVCRDCLEELFSEDRRADYPFINCTNCGPRFTLIEDFPYDRGNTSMKEFDLCSNCSAEFNDPDDRRFHAQPISCHDCGPHYEYHYDGGIMTDFEKIIASIAGNIDKGLVVAMKGLGGYHLACDAMNENAVKELRHFKLREKKPFAVMFRSLTALTGICRVSPVEESILTSWRRPIVILDQFRNHTLAESITSGLVSLGAFLPYLPLHHLLFDRLNTNAIVLTSGNESDTPILCREDAAMDSFGKISGGTLINNRRIARRADDSVVKVIDSRARIFRRARGYAPEPVDLEFDVTGILATGAELSNCFCIGKDHQAILSQHIGDLKNMETYEFFCENISEFSRLYRFEPEKIVCDLHPDYLSSQYAKESGLPVITVQHHHAHIAAVMAEYGLQGPVIGISYDGVGYGTDGHVWGSEVMVSDYKNFRRIGHFGYVPLPGGDAVTRQPWRTALSYLYQIYGENYETLNIPFLSSIDTEKARKLTVAIDKKINSPLCCSAGRLFDAVAALLCICLDSHYHAEPPLRLENYLRKNTDDSYPFSGNEVISFENMFREIIQDIRAGTSLEIMVTKFHNTVVQAALHQVKQAYTASGIRKVALSGGTFQNKYLTEKLVPLLVQNQFEVYYPQEVPCNDGGIALGQLAIAANKQD
jgi:hydrogenase maturation protein HypF